MLVKLLFSILEKLRINQKAKSAIQSNIKSYLNNNSNSLALEYLLSIISE